MESVRRRGRRPPMGIIATLIIFAHAIQCGTDVDGRGCDAMDGNWATGDSDLDVLYHTACGRRDGNRHPLDCCASVGVQLDDQYEPSSVTGLFCFDAAPIGERRATAGCGGQGGALGDAADGQMHPCADSPAGARLAHWEPPSVGSPRRAAEARWKRAHANGAMKRRQDHTTTDGTDDDGEFFDLDKLDDSAFDRRRRCTSYAGCGTSVGVQLHKQYEPSPETGLFCSEAAPIGMRHATECCGGQRGALGNTADGQMHPRADSPDWARLARREPPSVGLPGRGAEATHTSMSTYVDTTGGDTPSTTKGTGNDGDD